MGIRNNITPAHNGIEGNEEADALAKKRTDLKLHGPIPFCGILIEISKNRIKDWLGKKIVDNWYNRMDVRHSSNFINEPNIKKNFLFNKEKKA